MKCFYNGDRSKEFWERVNAVKKPAVRDALYAMGCSLQHLEWQTLKLLDDEEAKRPPRKRS